MSFGTTTFGVYAFGTDSFAAPAAPLLEVNTNGDAVYLMELFPASSAATPDYVALTFGTFTFGTLPYVQPEAPVVPLYVSDRDWTNRQSDPPDENDGDTPNQHYPGRAQLPQIDQSLPLPPNGNHRAGLTLGQLIIDNTDGLYDVITRELGIDARSVRIKRLPSRASRYAQATAIFTGVGVGWNAEGNNLVVTIADNSHLLSGSLLGFYGGTGGADGVAEIKDLPIPQVYGLCRNIAPQLVDPAKLIYQIHDRLIESFLAVKVRGASITYDGVQADYAALDAATVTSGTYQVALTAAGSYIRLGSTPDGPVTVDVRGDAYGGYVEDTANVMRRVLRRVLASSQLQHDSFDTLAQLLPGVIGVPFNRALSIGDAVAVILAGTYTYLTDLADGRMAVGRLGLPVAGSNIEINQSYLRDEPKRVPMPDSIAPCLWRMRVNYRRNWSPLSEAEIVPEPTLTTAERAALKQPFLVASQADSTRLSRHPAAGDVEMDSLYDEEVDAESLASYLLTLLAPGREFWDLPLGDTGHGIALNAPVNVVWPRGGLKAGKPMRVIGRSKAPSGVTLLGFG